MTHPYPHLNGTALLQRLRRKSLHRLISGGILLIAAIGFFTLLTVGIVRDFSHGFVLLFTVPLWCILLYVLIRNTVRALRLLLHAQDAEIFRRYGPPDALAERLADPECVQLLPDRRIILTRAYLMRRDDFTSYLPLTEITGMSVLTTKGGWSRHVQLLVTTVQGERRVYRFAPPGLFRSLDAQAKEITDALTAGFPQSRILQ